MFGNFVLKRRAYQRASDRRIEQRYELYSRAVPAGRASKKRRVTEQTVVGGDVFYHCQIEGEVGGFVVGNEQISLAEGSFRSASTTKRPRSAPTTVPPW